jgi:phospholipase D1/2
MAWLALPHEPEFAPNEAVARKSTFSNTSDRPHRSNIPFLGHPHFEQWKQIGRQYRQRWHGQSQSREVVEEEHEGRSRDFGQPRAKTTSRIQAVRSVSDWSHGVLTEHSIQDACEFHLAGTSLIYSDQCSTDMQLIREAEHYIYIGMSALITDIPSFYCGIAE